MFVNNNPFGVKAGGVQATPTVGVVPTARHADYVGAKIDHLGEGSRATVRAASAASKAADYLLAFRER